MSIATASEVSRASSDRRPHPGYALLALAISLCLWLIAPAVAHAQISTVAVSPPSSSIGVEQVIDLTVDVQEVQNLYAAEFTLHFDPSVVEVLDIRIGSMLQGGTPIIRVDNDTGTVMFAATLLNPAPAVSGSGSIAKLVLRGRANGGTVLSMEALLSDPGGTVLPARARGGAINVGDVQLPTSTARPTSTPRVTPSPVAPQPAQPTDTPAPPQPGQPTDTPAPPHANPTLPVATPQPGSTQAPPTLPPQPAGTIAPPAQGGETAQPMPTWTIVAPTSAPGEPAATVSNPTASAPGEQNTPAPPPATTIAGGTVPTAGPVVTQPATEKTAPDETKGLSKTAFIVILATLLSMVAILGVIVLISLSKWHQRNQA